MPSVEPYQPSTERERRSVAAAVDWIRTLAGEIGPRRPTSPAERRAAEAVVAGLGEERIDAKLEEIRAYSSFGYPFGLILACTLAPSLIAPRRRRTRVAVAALAAAALVGEGSLRAPLLSRALSRRRSQNVVATIEPIERAQRTIVLSCHLDTSRSGVMFDPRFVGALPAGIAILSAVAALGPPLELLAGRSPTGRRSLAALRALPAAGLAVLLSRELRGEEVAGANDNASGCAVVATLAAELAHGRPRTTRVVALFCGAEEAGTLGSQAFRREHPCEEWIFVNFDNVGGDCPVRFLRREGVIGKFDADPALVAAAERIARDRPELDLRGTDDPAGTTYDSSPILAHGGRAMTISVQDGRIPDLHWPTDTPERIDAGAVARTLEVGRELIAAVEAGDVD